MRQGLVLFVTSYFQCHNVFMIFHTHNVYYEASSHLSGFCFRWWELSLCKCLKVNPIPNHYLCCLQISFQSIDPFQVLHLCAELGLPLLQSYTLHHIASSLTSESVSRVLLTSESLLESCEDDMLKVALQRVHLDCISFIQTHTRTVFLSESFLLLPKDTLITIISDNKVGISIVRIISPVCRSIRHDHI